MIIVIMVIIIILIMVITIIAIVIILVIPGSLPQILSVVCRALSQIVRPRSLRCKG